MDSLSRRGFFTSGVAAATAFGFDLGPARAAARELKTARAARSKSACPFCSVSCPIIIHTLGEKVVHIEGDSDSPINRGKLCSKGASLTEIVTSGRRLTSPLYRAPGGADWQPLSWDRAIAGMARLIKLTRDAGFEATDAQGKTVNRLTNMAMMGRSGAALSKVSSGLGLVFCEIAGRQTFIEDWTAVAEAGAVLVIGSDPAENEPVGFRFILEARLKGKAKLVCVDPRFSRTAAMADLYVPIRAGTEAAFLSGIVHYALTTERFRAPGAPQLQLLKKHYSRYTPEKVAGICECTADELRRAAEIVTAVHTADTFCTVLAASGLARVAGVLQLLLGNSADLPRVEHKRGWGSLFDKMYRGGMEGLVSFGVNPLAEGPNTTKMREAFAKLEWMIVADTFETGTAAFWRKDAASIQTEVYLLPLAVLDLPSGTVSDREILSRLFGEIQRLYREEGGAAMVWDDLAREIAFAPGRVESAFPEYYEPVESPVEGANPLAIKFESAADRYGTPDKFPHVGIAYPLSAPFHGNFFVEVPDGLAREKGIASGDPVRVSSARGQVEGPAVVTKRLKARHVGLPIHWEFLGRDSGSLVHNLTASVYDSDSGAPENRGFLVNLEKI